MATSGNVGSAPAPADATDNDDLLAKQKAMNFEQNVFMQAMQHLQQVMSNISKLSGR
jgi:hypothetical protein